jgi:DNA-binding XRE family transcriptional regulator
LIKSPLKTNRSRNLEHERNSSGSAKSMQCASRDAVTIRLSKGRLCMTSGTRRLDTRISESAMCYSLNAALSNICLRIAYSRGARSQREVAAILGVSPQTVSNIEGGDLNVSLKTVQRYVGYLSIPDGKKLLKMYAAIREYIQ